MEYDGRKIIDPMEFFSKKEKEKEGFKSILKSPEEKIYIILSVIDDDHNSGVFDVCVGRTECYRKISWLLEAYPEYDIDKSVVLVECREINLKNNQEEYFMNNYQTASSVYSFCKQVEGFFENRDDVEFIEIDNYKSRIEEDTNSIQEERNLNGKVGLNMAPDGINQEAYEIWKEALDE